MKNLHCVLSYLLLFPFAVQAHLLSITATTPFPNTIPINARATATFTVTNIATKAIVTAINQSSFSSISGLTLTASTCGNAMSPGETCTVELTLQTPSSAISVHEKLKMWAKPTLDAVDYPIDVTTSTVSLPNLHIVALSSTSLPAVRDPVIAVSNNEWLLVTGSLNSFHDFSNNFISSIYVYDPNSSNVYSMNIADTDLSDIVKRQLSSSDVAYYQDGDTLYLIGGYYNLPSTDVYETLNVISSFDVPGIINAIKTSNTALAAFVHSNTSVPQFQVTGAQLNKIGDNFYLVYGHRCVGPYCNTLQLYNNSIYEFNTDATLAAVNIINTVTNNELFTSGWRRRDYTLAPMIQSGTEVLLALGGPFTPIATVVWRNAILISENIVYNNTFLTQRGNQYLAPLLSMYAASNNTAYVATFSGLSNLYWSSDGLQYDATTPYGNVLDLIVSNPAQTPQEYVNNIPLCSGETVASCLYMGLSAQFIHISDYYDDRHILLLDTLPQHVPTLIGYIYAGIVSTSQTLFGSPSTNYVSNQIYAVYVTPSPPGTITWQNVTSNL